MLTRRSNFHFYFDWINAFPTSTGCTGILLWMITVFKTKLLCLFSPLYFTQAIDYRVFSDREPQNWLLKMSVRCWKGRKEESQELVDSSCVGLSKSESSSITHHTIREWNNGVDTNIQYIILMSPCMSSYRKDDIGWMPGHLVFDFINKGLSTRANSLSLHLACRSYLTRDWNTELLLLCCSPSLFP